MCIVFYDQKPAHNSNNVDKNHLYDYDYVFHFERNTIKLHNTKLYWLYVII